MAFDPRLAEAIWWEEYVPLIRFVDVGGLAQPRAGILHRDPTDAPTIALAGLLGQVVVSAADADIRDLGVAAPDWLAVIVAGHDLSLAAGGAWGRLVTARIGGHSLLAITRGAITAARHPAGQLVIGALAAVLWLTRSRWLPRVREAWTNAGPRLESVVAAATPMVERAIETYWTADTAWEAAKFDGEPATLRQHAAQVLAESPYPLSRTEIARRLHPEASEHVVRKAMQEIGAAVVGCPAFVQVNARDWQLGRSGVDFGRERSESPLLLPYIPRPKSAGPRRPELVTRSGISPHIAGPRPGRERQVDS